jgi:uncharacterized membrane protein
MFQRSNWRSASLAAWDVPLCTARSVCPIEALALTNPSSNSNIFREVNLLLSMTTQRHPYNQEDRTTIGQVLDRNISALLERRRHEDRQKPLEERVADRITAFTGSMPFVYLHLLVFGAWIMVNLGWLPLKPFDPSFVILAMVASVEAIFLSTFVLITQNRMAMLADKRADLDLQVSLLTEHEITRVLVLVRAIGERLGVDFANDPEFSELSKDVLPERVLEKIERSQES